MSGITEIMEIATNAARLHIKSLRIEQGIDEHGRLDLAKRSARNLVGALNLLSKSLYDDESHFIQEIFQNSDDATYASDVQPELQLSLTDTHFYAWSNEAGFSYQDVEGVCSIAYSSKAGQPESTGEKGIGFKSLFKIADIITIRSLFYRFKLDTSPPLNNHGMLIPTWTDEPLPTDHMSVSIPKGGTLLILHLKPGIDKTFLANQLTNFNFSTLLFARKIRKTSLHDLQQGNSRTIVGTVDVVKDNVVTLEVRDQGSLVRSHKYIFLEHQVRGMPLEEKRPKCHPIKLAFPFAGLNQVSKHDNGRLDEQYMFAFQPMKKFGFSFMLHADFILKPDRSVPDGRSPWNIALRTNIIDAIFDSFKWLATDPKSPLQLAWPEFLLSLSLIQDPFFAPIDQELRFRLRFSSLVPTEKSSAPGLPISPQFDTPNGTYIVGDQFRLNKRPLLDEEHLGMSVATAAYTSHAEDGLRRIGVTAMDHAAFIRHFRDFILTSPSAYRLKSPEWHSSFASILTRYALQDANTLAAVRALEVVPLQSGDWTSAMHENIYLPDASGEGIPDGLTIRTVDAVASNQPLRYRLFVTLGIKPSITRNVCDHILREHRESSAKPDWTSRKLLEHAVYLFRAGRNPRDRDGFWFPDSVGWFRRSFNMVVPFGQRGKYLRSLFGSNKTVIWLHGDFEKPTGIDDTDQGQWLIWLYQWPQIVDFVPMMSDGDQLSDAATSLKAEHGSKAMFTYFKLIRNQLPLENQRWCRRVGDTPVSTNRGSIILRGTALPSLRSQAGSVVPLVDLDDPESSGWTFMEHFGVHVNANFDFWIHRLRLTSKGSIFGVSTIPREIYESIGNLHVDPRTVRWAFTSEPLICTTDGKWRTTTQVRWDSTFPYTQFPLISKAYPSCTKLFRTMLGVKSTDLPDLVEEITYQTSLLSTSQSQRPNLNLMIGLLQSLHRFLASGTTHGIIEKLKHLKMFPVLAISKEANGSSDQYSFLASNERFWIADIPWLCDKFKGHIPLLDYSRGNEPLQFTHIFNSLSMTEKLLTEAVCTEQSLDTSSERVSRPDLTLCLRKKVPYLHGMLVREVKPQAQLTRYLSELSALQVFNVRNIKLRRYVMDQQARLYGTDDNGEIKFIPDGSALKIYVHQHLGIPDLFGPLEEEFAQYLGLKSHRSLLFKVLTTDDPNRYLEALQRAGAAPTLGSSHVSGPSISHNHTSSIFDSIPTSDTDLVSTFQTLQIDPAVVTMTDTVRSRPQTRQQSSSPMSGGLQPTPAQTPNFSHVSGRADVSLMHSSQSRLPERTSGTADSTLLRSTWSDSPSAPVVVGEGCRLTSRTPAGSIVDETGYRGLAPTPDPPGDELMDIGMQHGASSIPASSSEISGSRIRPRFPGGSTSFQEGRSERLGGLIGLSYPTSGFQSLHLTTEDRPHEIGREGEYKVFTFLEERLTPRFTHWCWTSDNHNHYFTNDREKFIGWQGDFADFTFEDGENKLGHYLASTLGWLQNVDSNTKYHLEVKTTTQGLEERVLLSRNQVSMAKRLSPKISSPTSPATDVYVLVRVYDYNKQDSPPSKICFFPDPWRLICQGSLDAESEGGLYVKPTTLSAISSDGAVTSSFVSDAVPTHRDDPSTSQVEPDERHAGESNTATRTTTTATATAPATSFSFPPVTLWVEYKGTPTMEPGGGTPTYRAITRMNCYEGYSFEELRLADYALMSNSTLSFS